MQRSSSSPVVLVSADKATKGGGDEKVNTYGYDVIPFSDVEVKHIRNVFKGNREWNFLDVVHVIISITSHSLCFFAASTFSWSTFWMAAVFANITLLLGVTLSYHRNLAHKSFKLTKFLEYLFAYIGLHAVQGDPMWWVSTHRYHHKFTDTVQDPHSPISGFWYSHFNWCGGLNNVKDLEMQLYYRFLHRTYLGHPIALGILLYALGGFPYIVWGMGVRLTYTFHVTFLVNSVCHIWGHQAWDTGDLSKNNWLVAILTHGEGWHNNHHAFEFSARQGLEWWQIDMTWYTMKLLEFFGLATDLKVPTETQKQRMSFNTKTTDDLTK
ncbi:hypothetical protein GIB67_016157 [Kingdonia uniflora]|uniref:Fatty acid desaturase domain-containing protein n=1 Tax=Kingdonia uniflora TaxID=39325 RepID=A0A7J7N9I9_9MAGN|nr:hypothetical protein GIB67_016157 [Kingdonia uniflora]